jgi:hypothetical protein
MVHYAPSFGRLTCFIPDFKVCQIAFIESLASQWQRQCQIIKAYSTIGTQVEAVRELDIVKNLVSFKEGLPIGKSGGAGNIRITKSAIDGNLKLRIK